MSTHVLAAGPVGDPTTTVSVFVGFVLMTLYVVYRVSNRNATASDYYVAGGNITGAQNGIALAGDWLSAASFLGVASDPVCGVVGGEGSVWWRRGTGNSLKKCETGGEFRCPVCGRSARLHGRSNAVVAR